MNETKVIFDMPFEEYLKVDALSSSAIKTINVSVSDYIEEKNQDTSTKSKDLGRAYHKRLLEGAKAFNNSYAVKRDKSEFLDGVNEIKAFIKDNGGEYTSKANKPELCDIARDLNANLYIDYLEDETREFLSKDVYDRINKFGELFHEHDQYFGKGVSEVVVLWNWDGVPCKARFDYIIDDGFVDLKTFTNPLKKSLETLPAQIISNYRYDVQTVFYNKAYEVARVVKPDTFKASEPIRHIIWVQQEGGFNIIRTRLQPDSEEFYQVNAYWNKAYEDIKKARDTYNKHIINKQEIPFFLHDDYLEDHHFPSYHFNK